MTAGPPSLTRRALASLRVPPPVATTVSPTILPSDVPIEEEIVPNYNPQHFYPVNPGDIFYRYEMTAKLGCGSCSTVWLARDIHRYVSALFDTLSLRFYRWRWQSDRYMTLKVNNCNFPSTNAAEHELNICRHITKTNPSHEGHSYVRTITDSFEVVGPHGTHICLVYKPMRDPLWLFQDRLKDSKFPLLLLKGYLKLLLQGLDYLHSECHIIHTGKFDATLGIN